MTEPVGFREQNMKSEWTVGKLSPGEALSSIHRWQPTRLPRPWGSPGKNNGVGCRFLLQCMKVKSESEVIQSCPTLRDPMDCSQPGSSVHGIFQARVLEWGAIAFSTMDLSLGELQDSVMDREAWLAVLHGVTKNRTRLSN